MFFSYHYYIFAYPRVDFSINLFANLQLFFKKTIINRKNFETALLDLLQEDCRLPLEKLSVMTGASMEEVAEAIDGLEKNRIILRYSPVINWDLTDRERVEAMIEVRVTPQRDMGFDAIARRIYCFDEVKSVFLMSGQGQLMLEQVPRSEPQQQTNETRQEEQEVNNNFCVPLVPLAAMGGSLSDYEGSVNDWECEWIPSPIRNATLAISVSGDSMSPEFPNGSTVIVTRINERAFIEWGRTYVLDTVNGVVIKNLVPSEKGDGWVRCVSVNKDPEFAPFDVSLSDVRAIFRVVVSMSVK